MSREASVLEVDHITSVLQRRCESMGVTLKWQGSRATPSTDGKTISLPAVHSPVTKEQMDKLYGHVIHECGHHSRPDAFAILNAAQPDPTLGAIYNICEDDGMEREVANAYNGDAIALGVQNSLTVGEIVTERLTNEFDPTLTEEQVAPLALVGLGQLSRLEWDGMSNASRAAFFNGMPPVAKKLVDDLITEGWVDKMQATNDAHDTWDLAIDLYKRLIPGGNEDELEQQRAKGHSMESPDNSDGDPQQATEGEDDTEADGTHGMATGEDGTPPDKPDEGLVMSWQDAVLSEHDDWSEKELGDVAGNIGIDWTDYQRGEVCLMPRNMINVVDLRNNVYSPESTNDWDGVGSPESFMPDNSGARAFGNLIRRYLQAQRRTRVRRERYHGKLDKSSLVKLAMPPIDGGEWNKRLFYDLDRRKEMDTCIHVLTDWSGSMQGMKMVHAADASGRLVHVFDRVLRVPVQLAAFTNARSRCDIGLIKGFNDRSITQRNIAENFSKFYKFSSANNDADAVMWAYRELLRRKEERKILIVLSDGCPAGSWKGSSHSNLLHVTQAIEQSGDVELYGVGICSNAVETYYSNSKTLHSSDEINNTLFEIIKQGAYK